MRLWDRGRLGEFGIDLRGSWVHRLACWLFLRELPYSPRRKQWHRQTPAERRMAILERRMARLNCFCEACWREFLPWPFSW